MNVQPSTVNLPTARTAARVLWITGRPASGKSTLARAVAEELIARGIRASVVDSDEVRAAITPEPRYTAEERALFYRALAYLAARLAQEGIVAIVAATAHAAEHRRWARELCPGLFLIYARCPLAVCEARDPKGLYRRARADPASTLPGLGVPYEEPDDADRVVDTAAPVTREEVADLVDTFLSRGSGTESGATAQWGVQPRPASAAPRARPPRPDTQRSDPGGGAERA